MQTTSTSNQPQSSVGAATPQIMRIAVLGACVIFAAWLLISLAACSTPKHGKFTSEGQNAAQKRLDTIKAQTEYTMALQAFLDSDLNKALKHCEKAIILAPTVVRCYVLRGRIMMEKSDLQQAEVSLARAIEVDAANVDAYYYRGLLAERVARKQDALTNYMKACELDTQNPQYPIAAAEMLIDLGDLDGAESFLNERQTAFQHHAGIQQTLGHISMLRGDFAKAELRFSEARILAPNETDVLEDLARAQFNLSKWGEAEACLSRLLKAPEFSDRRDLSHMRAQCLTSLNRNAEARDLLVTLTKSDEGQADTQAWISLGQVAYAIKDWSRVRQSFVRVLALAPERCEGYVLKGLHQRRTEDFKGAEQSFRRAIEISPSGELYILLGLVYQRLDNETAARTCFARAAKLDPTDKVAQQLVLDPSMAAKIAGAETN